MGVQRVKSTIPPPEMCDGCYHEARSDRLQRYLRRMRADLIVTSVERNKLRIKVKTMKEKTLIPPEPREYNREDEQDGEVADLVEQFKRGQT